MERGGLIIQNNNRPMYEQIYYSLLEDINKGKYKVGDKIPSEHDLAIEYNVSRITSKKALELLSLRKIIIRKPGKGSFVADPIENIEEKIVEVEEEKGKFIGVVITDFDNAYATKILHSIEEEARKKGYFLILRRTLGDVENEKESIEELIKVGVEALIILPVQGEYFSESILKLVVNKFPFVLIDRYLKGIPTISVSTDNIRASIEAVEYLFKLNHKNIALISSAYLNTTAIEERMEGFVTAHEKNGIIANKKLWLNDLKSTIPNAINKQNIDEDIKSIKKLLEENPEITAIFATEYKIALLCEKAINELNLIVPNDISIICFDAPDNLYSDGTKFTHIKQNEREIGRIAFESVLSINPQEDTVNNIFLDYDFIVGESTSQLHKK